MTKRTHKSDVFAAIHETMEGLYEAELIDKKTMRDFDTSCLAPITPITGSEIKELRERENVSQSIFAIYLNVSKNLISDWERDIKKPGGPALKLLAIVQRHGLELLT
jgi:putative transcriptional regulator